MLPKLLYVNNKTLYSTRLCIICRKSFTALSINDVILDLNKYGSLKDNNKIIELWKYCEENKLNKNNACSRSFLYWFSSLGQIDYTLDVISSLIPNVTTNDTLQLLQSYQNAKDHKMAQYALQLLVDNQFELDRKHFDILISISANNGDIQSIINTLNIMISYNIEPNEQTLKLIFSCLENYFEQNKYLLSNVNIHSIINEIETNDVFSLYLNDEMKILFMKWYCQFGDVNHALILYDDESFKKHAIKNPNIMQKLAIEQLSLLFKNKINLSKGISLLHQILQIEDYSLYKLFDSNNNEQIIPKSETPRRLFIMLNEMKTTNWYHVNILNFLLHICYLSRDLHNALYILHEWQIKYHQIENNQEIIPNYITIEYISKLFASSISSKSIQPKTIEWSLEIYQYLLDKYKNNSFILDIISNLTQHLLKLLLIHGVDDDNIQRFCHVLRCVKTVIPDFETDPNIFTMLGKSIVNNETQIKNVLNQTIDIYGYMLETRDGTSNTYKITSVSDRARLLGAILTTYDQNICNIYQQTIGGPSQSYFQLRRDLQQKFVLELHRKYSLNDILTLDVLSLTDSKPVNNKNNKETVQGYNNNKSIYT